MTPAPLEPAIPVNGPRSLQLSGVLLAALLLARSPLGGIGSWAWWLLAAAALARAILGDRVGLRRVSRGGGVWWLWVFLAGTQVLDRDWVGLTILPVVYLLVVALPPPRLPGASLHPTHHALYAAAVLLGLEAVGVDMARSVRGAQPRWVTFGGDPWQELLSWIGLVVVVAALLAWLDRTQHLARSLREARDHTLRLKLAPHFIFNTLNTLKAQLERDPQEAGATVDRLAALYRQVLERTERPTTPLREELDFVEAYLGIEQVRLGSRLRVTIDVPEGLEERSIPTLGLQTLVENAVKHGIAPREDGGELLIRVAPREDPRWLQVSVESPAPAGDAALALSGPGTGLRTLRARLASPSALRTEVRDGRFLATFSWESPEATPPLVEAAAPARAGA